MLRAGIAYERNSIRGCRRRLALVPKNLEIAPIGYIRLHGRRYDTWFNDDPAMPAFERYNYLYSAEELAPWAGRIGTRARSRRKFLR